MIFRTQAIASLAPGANFRTFGDEIFWDSPDINQPSEEDIVAKAKELEDAFNAKEYQRKREREYPSWQDQLDDIYHNGVTEWKKTIKVTKDKYPKP